MSTIAIIYIVAPNTHPIYYAPWNTMIYDIIMYENTVLDFLNLIMYRYSREGNIN